MIKVTQDLKDTLRAQPDKDAVYFNRQGHHFFSVHKHEKTGVLYSRIKDQQATISTPNAAGMPSTKSVRIYEVDPKDEITDTLSAQEVLSAPISDSPEFADAQSKALYEKQSQELDELKKQLAATKSDTPSDTSNAELEALKAELAKTKEENETLQEMIAESEKKPESTDAKEDTAKA